MIIGVDIRVLGNKVKSGIEEYVESLMPYLIKEGKDIQFKLFYSSYRNTLPEYEWLKEPNIKLYKFSYPNNFLFTYSRLFHRPFIDKMVGGADIFFFPHFFLSSLSPECKRVTTFHDLSYLHFPEFLTLRKRIWHNLQMAPKWQAKFSNRIVAVSESTKNDLIKFYKIDPAKIDVIYSGVDKEGTLLKLKRRAPSKISNVESTFDVVNNFKRAKHLPDRFIFVLGKLEPRKNIVTVIKAFNNVKIDPKYKNLGLIIAGAKGWLYKDIIEEARHAVSSGHGVSVIFTGQITDKERFLYYHAAELFVYPSFFEGFGFPPLEAMNCSTPVITSRNSSLPEVVGDAAIMIDPYDIGELELWTKKLLDDNSLKRALVARGKERARLFQWETTAKKTLECLVK